MKSKSFLTILILIFTATSPLLSVDDPDRVLESGEHAITKRIQQTMTPHEIIGYLKKGNQRFIRGDMLRHNYLQEMRETSSDQYPPAIILSCIDSRTTPEIVFDVGIGDIFDVRVAGNIMNEDIAGSLEYATKVAGSKVVLVMGHTGCGAVKGAVDDIKLGNLTGLLAKLKPAVDAVDQTAGARTSKNKKFVDTAAIENVKLTIENIRRISPVLRELEKENKILIKGCLYDIKTGRVLFLDEK